MQTIEELRADLVEAEVVETEASAQVFEAETLIEASAWTWEKADETWHMARTETERIKDEIEKKLEQKCNI